MATTTKAQIQAQLEALRAHCDRVETERDSLKADNAAQAARIAKLIERGTVVRVAHDEAVEALHRLKGELLATKLPQRETYRGPALGPVAARLRAACEEARRMGVKSIAVSV